MTFLPHTCIACWDGCGRAMVLEWRPTNLDNSRTRAYFACSSAGDDFLAMFTLPSFSFSLEDGSMQTKILS